MIKKTSLKVVDIACRGLLCKFFIILLLITPALSNPENDFLFPLKSDGNLSFYADVYQFMNSQGDNSTEISYSINLSQFSLPGDSAKKTISFSIALFLLNVKGDTLAQICEQKSIAPDETMNPQKAGAFVDLKRFTLQADTVRLYIDIKSSIRNFKGNISKTFAVKSYSNSFSISDLFFATFLQKSSGTSNFEKHGFNAIPNPLRVFTFEEKTPNIYVYYEINNMEFNAAKASPYSVYYTISDLAGREVTSFNRPAISKTNANCARFEVIPLKDLKHGLYLLKMNVTDLSTGNNCSTARYFEIYQASESNNQVLSMTDDDIKKYFDQIKYIATHEEKELYGNLDARGKQEFLLNFWRTRDPDPETAVNEFMQEHFKRLQYAESKFNGGVNSDMGRIFIQYGPALDIQRQFSSTEINRPIEIWSYAFEGKTEFIFADRSGDGHYVLVHSTHPDEFQNPDWMNVMK